VVVSFIGGGVHGVIQQHVTSHWQTLSHTVVSSTTRHVRDSNYKL